MRPLAMILTLAAILSATTESHADPILDQEYDPTNPGSTGYIGYDDDFDRAQTFEVGKDGLLTSVEVLIARGSSTTEALLFDIRTTNSGDPTEGDSGPNVLFSASIDAADIGTTFGFFEIVLGVDALDVETGDVLALVLRSEDSNNNAYQWKGTSSDGYSGGAAFDRMFGGDWGDTFFADAAFRTHVDVTSTPEPSTLVLMGLAVAGIAWRRRRSR